MKRTMLLTVTVAVLTLCSNVELKNFQNSSYYEFDAKESLVSDEDSATNGIKALLEKKYRFKNTGDFTRYKITKGTHDFPVFPKSNEDDHIEMVFRTYAARRIVGGMQTSISVYPYNVAISHNGRHWCGGAIIDEQWVLTAGHCMESVFENPKNIRQYTIRAGSSFHDRGGYLARINKVFYPKDYEPGEADYDFSLLRLDRPMPIGRNIAVLNLPAKQYNVDEGDILIVSGWGSTHPSGYGHIPDRIRFVPVPVMAQDKCQKSYNIYITPRMLCAGYPSGGKDSCNHDSGGPAVNKDGVLIGLVSFGGKNCGAPNSPGVYSRVSEITDWVERTINDNEAFKDPDLIPKIERARERERELQRFQAHVENKKNKIKNWLRDTLNSPTFIKTAKKKLREAGIDTRRSLLYKKTNSAVLGDKKMDDLNLINWINEKIIGGDGDVNESEKILRILALEAVVLHENENQTKRMSDNSDLSVESILGFIADG
ncbi:trypsin-5 [Bombyx mori]|uniref:trypsin n=1 Tax=Bombyx mori TaxID=7091 RepID=A0A8R2HN76_BOMMO|nr:trypsin-5 [Bombyx mori]